MPTFEEIYTRHADMYERLIAREDYQGNLLPALEQIQPLGGLDVVEAGAGTGRLTRLLVPVVRSIRAFDASGHMLATAEPILRATGSSNWTLDVARNDDLPVPNGSADLGIEGWSFGHATEWHADAWREHVGAALRELVRAVRPGGTIILLETMGTGRATPQPPSDALAALYDWLERVHGFATTTIRTDYRFASVAEADELATFFFNTKMPTLPQSDGSAIVQECTGIWWKRV
jgi:SAM-dependent methyltransferase